MLSRTISKACLLLCLGWLGACDDAKTDAKTDPKAKAEEKKADDKKAEEKKAETKVEEKAEAKVEEKAEAKAEEKAEAKAEEKAEAKAEEKAEEKKADEKTEEKKVEEKKGGDKPSGTTEKPDPGPSADGKGLYEKKCKNCHNGNGDGKTKIGEENEIEDWTVAGWKAKWSQEKIEDIVTNGKSGTKMKPFKDKMTADEIVAVSKFARSLGK